MAKTRERTIPNIPVNRLSLAVPKPVYDEVLRFAHKDAEGTLEKPNVSITLRDLIWRGLLQRRAEECGC